MGKHYVSLEVSSYCGISVGATHVYGHLVTFDPHEKIELTRKLTAQDAEKLNKGEDDHFGAYKEGDDTQRFDTLRELRELAIKTFREKYPDAIFLFEDKGCSSDPCKVLIGPESIIEECNEIHAEAERIGFWGYDEDKMEKLADRWDELMKSVVQGGGG